VLPFMANKDTYIQCQMLQLERAVSAAASQTQTSADMHQEAVGAAMFLIIHLMVS